MENYHKINTVCLFILTSIAVAFVLATTKVILIPFTLSIFIALVYTPFIQYLQRKLKVHNTLALFLSITIFIILISIIGIFITKSVDSFVSGADQYKEKFGLAINQMSSSLQRLGVELPNQDINSLSQKFPLGKIIKNISGSLINILSNTFLVVIFTLFLITGEGIKKKHNSVIEEIKRNASKYIQTKLLTSATTALMSYVVLLVFRVEMAFMFALVTFLLNFIPNIGSIFAIVLPVPIILLQFGIGWQFGAILLLLIGTQVIIGNIIEPKLMGQSMGLHPVTILLFLTFWGYIWGITGMFLSVPITATLKIILDKFEFTRPVSRLFSGELS